LKEEAALLEGTKQATNEESITATTADARVKNRTVTIASIPSLSNDGALSANHMTTHSATRPRENIAYAYRRPLSNIGTAVTTHVTFVEKKKFKRALMAEKPPTAILTYVSMLESG
jgi:hypothetical protein